MNEKLKTADSHFAFGENWASYAHLIDQSRLAKAREGLVRLLGEDGLRDKTVLDIGCGSGLHAVAAQALGARRVLGVDIDRSSVATSRQVFARMGTEAQCSAQECSVFELENAGLGQFDVVYSWGVLHHTGAMHEALEKAAGMTAPGGTFVFALYRKTKLCWLWKVEKRWYAKASPTAQRMMQRLYIGMMRLAYWLLGRDFKAHLRSYKEQRGMDFEHDVHDWLGGYPYESISPAEVAALMGKLGFDPVRSFTRPGGWAVFGSGCDEFVFRRS
ncbi:MAG: class I SAM-dependent methyltransferase [Ferrovibrio sp.]|uniref:class I SAM-dependent methyltransferase n=1 Tax=Ferrovibrio sp. TaxID=1917215 RepID=UPI002627C9C4|nr:class I SAM-dependent methyltransferase [Ferrovibrio sp.]MCW0233322.1 class I SAM-dependent methyltransferase [Ferrovibrio sp.]